MWNAAEMLHPGYARFAAIHGPCVLSVVDREGPGAHSLASAGRCWRLGVREIAGFVGGVGAQKGVGIFFDHCECDDRVAELSWEA